MTTARWVAGMALALMPKAICSDCSLATEPSRVTRQSFQYGQLNSSKSCMVRSPGRRRVPMALFKPRRPQPQRCLTELTFAGFKDPCLVAARYGWLQQPCGISPTTWECAPGTRQLLPRWNRAHRPSWRVCSEGSSMRMALFKVRRTKVSVCGCRKAMKSYCRQFNACCCDSASSLRCISTGDWPRRDPCQTDGVV